MSQQAAAVSPGTLYVVATPIGNLGDFSPRAQAVLREVSAVCAEDTRTTGGLLAQFGIPASLVAMHEHNEDRLAERLVARLAAGEALALVSDAGTPLISDPGYALVSAARDAGLPVVSVPGPCALVAALAVAGLPTDEFLFAGFLPHKAGERRRRLEALAQEPRTVVVYESPHRIEEAVADLAAVLGERRVCLCRELTKRFEESVRLPADALPVWLAADANRRRGEFVLVLEGAPRDAVDPAPGGLTPERLLTALMSEMSPSRAARLAAELLGQKRGPLYELAEKLKPTVPRGSSDENI